MADIYSSSIHVFYIVLVMQFILNMYIQNTKLEWAILSSLLVTIILTGGLFIGYVSTPGNAFNTHMQTTLTLISTLLIEPLYLVLNKPYSLLASTDLITSKPPILMSLFLLIPIILIAVSIAIVINNRDKNIKKETEAKIKTYKNVLFTNILIGTGIVVYLINADAINKVPGFERSTTPSMKIPTMPSMSTKINIFLNAIKNILSLPYHILITVPDYIISKIDPSKENYIAGKLSDGLSKAKAMAIAKGTDNVKVYGLPLTGLSALYGSSIWMILASIEIMNQYKKDE